LRFEEEFEDCCEPEELGYWELEPEDIIEIWEEELE